MKLLKVIFLMTVLLSSNASAKNSFADALNMMNQADSQKAFVQRVAELAKAGDSDALYNLMDSSRLPKEGAKDYVDNLLNTQIFPFFKDYEKLSNYQGHSKAVVPGGGKEGMWHYMYIVTSTGAELPFSIAVVDGDDGYKIMDISVNKCVKNRHPICN